MKTLKTFEEYRYFKVDPSKDNIKDPNEPFFMEPKYDYKLKKEIFGDDYKDTKEKIKIDEDVIDNLIKTNELSGWFLNKIKEQCKYYEKFKKYVEKNGDDESTDDMYPDNSLTFHLEIDEIRKLKSFGFGIYIYDDSNEFSDNFSDKCRVSWDWK